jgi:hypothetical protein
MMNRELWLLGISSLILGLVLLLVFLAVLHRRRLNQISDQLAEGAVDNGETLKGVVERENAATRKHVSGAVDAIRHDTKFAKDRIVDFTDRQIADGNEMRGQMTALRERLRAVVQVTDTLLKRLHDLPAQVGEWLHKKPPP